MISIAIILILLGITILPVYGLQQTVGQIEISLNQGERTEFLWGLLSDGTKSVMIHLRAEGKGSEFLSFPETILLEPKIMKYVKITVDIPNDVDSAEYRPSLYATQKGEGLVSVNLSMQKNITITITDSKGGGCLIATAVHGTEMAPQIQMLREIRDGKLMQTESGRFFMNSFNSIYYSFSPLISDYQRENDFFNGIVQLFITPMISSPYIMEYAESESKVIGYGISVIVLNGLFYGGIPAATILFTRKIMQR